MERDQKEGDDGIQAEAPPRSRDGVQKESPAAVGTAGPFCPRCGRMLGRLNSTCPCDPNVRGDVFDGENLGPLRLSLLDRLIRNMTSAAVTPLKLFLAAPAFIVCCAVVAADVRRAQRHGLANGVALSWIIMLGIPVLLGMFLACANTRRLWKAPPGLAVWQIFATVFAWIGLVFLAGALACCVLALVLMIVGFLVYLLPGGL